MWCKKLVFPLSLALLFAVSCDKKALKGEEGSADDGKAVATVNGTAITRQQLKRIVVALNKQNELSGQTPQDQEKVKKAALRKLVEMELLYQEALAHNVKVPEEKVEKALNDIKAKFPDEENFKAVFSEALTSEAQLRDDIKRNLYIETLIEEELVPQVEVSEEESQELYNERKAMFVQPESVQISHILVKLDNKAGSEQEKAAREKIESIKKRLKNNEDFADIAREHSDCPSAEKGGDLGFIPRGQTVSEFEQCAFSLEEPGQISEITRTSFGFHILKRGEKREEKQIPFEDVRDKIVNYLKSQKVKEKFPEYVNTLLAKARIDSDIELEMGPKSEDPQEHKG